jgi:hypothetical protein
MIILNALLKIIQVESKIANLKGMGGMGGLGEIKKKSLRSSK